MSKEGVVEYLERLVLVEFKGEERERIRKEVRKVLELFKELDSVPELDRYEPLFYVHDVSGPMREDEPLEGSELKYEDLELNRPLERGFFKAPRTVVEE